MKAKNPRSQRLKESIKERWYAEDHPGGTPRFQLALFAKDVGIFVVLPILAIVLFKSCENALSTPKRPTQQREPLNRDNARFEDKKSQIIDFRAPVAASGTGGIGGIARRSPGSLVRVRLLNVVETYGNAPVHAQIVDAGLGRNLMGGTLIGDAVADSNFERINVTFRFARDPSRENVAVPITARALGLDGTLGLSANKKEGFFTRSALGSAGSVSQDLQGKGGNATEFKDVLIKALTAGLIQEFGSGTLVERNRAQVLTLTPSTEFFAELTDFFPGAAK